MLILYATPIVTPKSKGVKKPSNLNGQQRAMTISLLRGRAFHQCSNVFHTPTCTARRKFYGLRITASLYPSPPRTLADGNDGGNPLSLIAEDL